MALAETTDGPGSSGLLAESPRIARQLRLICMRLRAAHALLQASGDDRPARDRALRLLGTVEDTLLGLRIEATDRRVADRLRQQGDDLSAGLRAAVLLDEAGDAIACTHILRRAVREASVGLVLDPID